MVLPFQKRSDQSFLRMGKLGREAAGGGGAQNWSKRFRIEVCWVTRFINVIGV